jgi:hypothetical protein
MNEFRFLSAQCGSTAKYKRCRFKFKEYQISNASSNNSSSDDEDICNKNETLNLQLLLYFKTNHRSMKEMQIYLRIYSYIVKCVVIVIEKVKYTTKTKEYCDVALQRQRMRPPVKTEVFFINAIQTSFTSSR